MLERLSYLLIYDHLWSVLPLFSTMIVCLERRHRLSNIDYLLIDCQLMCFNTYCHFHCNLHLQTCFLLYSAFTFGLFHLPRYLSPLWAHASFLRLNIVSVSNAVSARLLRAVVWVVRHGFVSSQSFTRSWHLRQRFQRNCSERHLLYSFHHTIHYQ